MGETEEVMVIGGLVEIVYTLGESEDNGREEYGDKWEDAISLAYRDAMVYALPSIPVEDHNRFSRALFTLRGVAHRETGLDEDPES